MTRSLAALAGISMEAPVWACTERNTCDNVEFVASMVSKPFWYVTRGAVGGICSGVGSGGAGCGVSAAGAAFLPRACARCGFALVPGVALVGAAVCAHAGPT